MMMTVKEISKRTGISVRTLHYYDEIGLFSPTEKTEAGYRLYDDKALETLQQILFFREFDIPLKEIKTIMQNPAFERNQILEMQRKMLVAKKERIERLIFSIDDILKGENKMDFAVFDKTEVEDKFYCMYDHMTEDMRNMAVEEFGGIEEWKKHYMDVVLSEEMQEMYAKVVSWCGGKDAYKSVSSHPLDRDASENYGRRIEAIFAKFAEKKDCPPDAADVKEIVEEYASIMKQLTQAKDEAGMMRYLAWFQTIEPSKSKMDKRYGEGTAEFIARAIEAFYNC